MSKNIIRKVMLILLLMSILNAVFAFDLVEADQFRDGEAGTVMSLSTLDEGMSRENSKHPSILELRDEKNDSSDFCTPFDCGLSSNPPSSNFINVSVADAKGMIESIEYLVLVDVRNSEEYLNSHIGNAVHIPLSQCNLRSRQLSTRKALLVYCRCGIRSIKACRIFAKNGFENVYNMLGGIEAWSNAEYPLSVSVGHRGILSSYDKLGESTPSSLYPGATSVDDEATNIKDINNAIASAGANWIAGKTQVSRLAFDERKLRCGAILQPIEGAERLSKPVGVIPIGTFDWRNVNETDWMTPVKAQGACGSCWAFGTLGSMEAVINIVSQNPTMDVDLSEQFLVSCCDECGDCEGGRPDTTYDFIMDTGVPTESCFPYVASNVPCAPCQWWEYNVYKITSWFQVSNDADSIKWALQSYGPLGVGMYAPDDFLYYKSGVYEPVWSSPEWEEEFLYGGGNHWVTLVGYNDSEGYWIVKNSWGSNWGEEGYGKIAFGVIENNNYILAIQSVEIPVPQEHDLAVTLQVPKHVSPGNTSLLNTTIWNLGLNNETNVELFLLINDTMVNSVTIPAINNGTSHTINHSWTPMIEGLYNVTIYARAVPGENVTANNVATKIVNVRTIKGYVLFDQTHRTDNIAYYSVWVANLTCRGYAVDSLITSPIVPSMLEGYDIFVIPQALQQYSSGELLAIQNFVLNGGGILVIGDNEEYVYTDLTSFAGITWIYGGTSGVTVDITPHPVTENVSSVYLHAPLVEMLVTAPAVDLVRDPAGGIMLAASELVGRVIGFADEGSLWNYGIHQEDNLQLANNMIDWLLYVKYEHELVVRLDAPDSLMPGDSWLLSATVCNRGLNNETDLQLFLMINDVVVNNETIHELLVGSCFTINYLWTPLVEAVYNVTAYAPPVSGENVTINNVMSRLVHVRSLPSDQPVVYVNPHVVTAVIGETFTVAVNLFNVTEPFGNLYGFDVRFAWNPAIIEYVSHTITVPVEEYPDGVLHEPIMPIMEIVRSDYVRFSYTSLRPAEPFNNPNASNSIFLITFKAVGEGTSKLRFAKVDLANVYGQPIVHSCIDGLVTAAPQTCHDVAVINVSSCADTVYTGRTVNITVLAANKGIATETFNITLYANSTVIGVQTLTLYRGENATLTFSWNTTGLAPCSNFIILAKASQVPFETNIVNNICYNGWIRIKMLGDLNGDDIINIYDIVLAAAAYNSRPGDPNWNPEADVAQPYQHINMFDMVTISSKYGQTPYKTVCAMYSRMQKTLGI